MDSSTPSKHDPSLGTVLGRSIRASLYPNSTTEGNNSAGSSNMFSGFSRDAAGSVDVDGHQDADQCSAFPTEDDPLLRGKLSGFVGHLKEASSRHFLDLIRAVCQDVLKHWEELLVILLIMTLPIITVRLVYKSRYGKDYSEEKFEKSAAYRRAVMVSELGRVLGLLYCVDILVLFLSEFGVDLREQKYPVAMWAYGAVLFAWASRFLSQIKQCYIKTALGSQDDESSRGMLRVASRGLDFVIYTATLLATLDYMSIETGFALNSIFGLSSFGTLVFSLASRELVAEFMSSLAIKATNMFKVGDYIWLGDGTQGTVQNFGWLNTHLRMGDEKVVKVPNSQIARARSANISRAKLSSISQKLAVSYEEWKKLPKVCQDIRTEIEKDCPSLITNGSRPYRVQWMATHKLYLEIAIDAHFEQRPSCRGYFELKETFLTAVMRACDNNDLRFAYKDFKNAAVDL